MADRGWIRAAARWRWTAPLAVLVAALAFSLPHWNDALRWGPDGLFYRAQSMEVRGDSAEHARQAIWTGPLSASLRGDDRAGRFSDPRWVDYSAQFYRRRWSVPAMAAAIEPIEHERSLLIVSLLGYVALGLALCALLRTAFGAGISAVASIAVLALPAVRDWSFTSGTESWGVALECAALLAGLAALRHGRWWIAAWVAAMVALAFTRDATVVPLAAVALVALLERTRRSALVLGLGVLAAAPAALLFGARWASTIHYQAAGYNIPGPGRSLLHDYASLLKDDLTGDGGYLLHRQPLMGLAIAVMVIGLVVVARTRSLGDGLLRFWPGMVVGCVLMLLINPLATEFRLELVWVPAIAVGVAVAAEHALSLARPRLTPVAPSTA